MINLYLFVTLVFTVIVLFWWIYHLKSILLSKERKILELQIIFDKAPLFIDSFDEAGKCTLWNKECQRVFGWTLEEINLAKNSLALFYPDEEDQKETLEQLERSGHGRFVECYPRTKEGEIILSKWTVVPLPSGEKIAIGYNITEENTDKLKERTLQLNETKKKLAELNVSLEERVKNEIEKNKEHQKLMILQSRHAQMGETISIIAHQWRQPLNILSLIIQDNVFKYNLGNFEDKDMKALNEDSTKQIQEMSETITNFRNFFKPEKEQVEFDIADVVKNAVNIMQVVLEVENIHLEMILEKGIVAKGHPSELGQSIVNIIANAKDALIQNSIKDKYIHIELISTIDKATITIRDNAGGIPADIMPKIFDPYFSTKLEKHGTGLGLYISKIIIENHMNGELNVSNDENGTVFEIVCNCLL